MTVTDLESLPSRLRQVNTKVLVACSGPVDSEPDVGRCPAHVPEAVHESAFVDDHRNVDAVPASTVDRSTLKEVAGAVASPLHAVRARVINAAKTARDRGTTRCVITSPNQATPLLSWSRA